MKAFKTGSSNIVQYTTTLNQTLDGMMAKTNSSLAKSMTGLTNIRNGLISLSGKTAQDHSMYDAEIEKLNQLIT